MPHGYKNAVAKDEIGIPMPYWSEDEICCMDIKFTDAMMIAIAAGLEQCTVGVRTAAGTKRPIINYRRPDKTVFIGASVLPKVAPATRRLPRRA